MKKILTVLVLLVLVQLACVGGTTATQVVQPTYTAQPTYTPYPTQVPVLPTAVPAKPQSMSLDDAAVQAGWTRAPSLDSSCTNQDAGTCHAYTGPLNSVLAIFSDGFAYAWDLSQSGTADGAMTGKFERYVGVPLSVANLADQLSKDAFSQPDQVQKGAVDGWTVVVKYNSTLRIISTAIVLPSGFNLPTSNG